ncbi:hypothetical protein Hypma_000411 [Hypsizygus marmoreus]|uniref:Uncharacterized protein n=1 Tax=Hypsizygus marmoreus TaxID=39966 RepID=A0A369J8Q9_HYPMA|nr:hypothetical protein Hypma_000411 [Hypsizygus marmoreus]
MPSWCYASLRAMDTDFTMTGYVLREFRSINESGMGNRNLYLDTDQDVSMFSVVSRCYAPLRHRDDQNKIRAATTRPSKTQREDVTARRGGQTLRNLVNVLAEFSSRLCTKARSVLCHGATHRSTMETIRTTSGRLLRGHLRLTERALPLAAGAGISRIG